VIEGDPAGERLPAAGAPASDRGRSLLGPRILGAALLVLGIAVLYGAVQIGRGTGFRPVGAGFVPTAVGTGLVVLSIAFLVRSTVRPDEWLAERAAEEEAATHWLTVAGLAAVLVGYAIALQPIGYILATAALVPLAAWLLGSRNPLRDVLVGAAVAVVVWVAFTQFLGVRLPAGLLDPIV